MSYAYNAEMFCDSCAAEIMIELDNADHEDSGDTDEYPQSDGGNDESDCPQHCAECAVFLENSLTTDGYDYVKGAVETDLNDGRYDSIACREWASYYGIKVKFHFEVEINPADGKHYVEQTQACRGEYKFVACSD